MLDTLSCVSSMCFMSCDDDDDGNDDGNDDDNEVPTALCCQLKLERFANDTEESSQSTANSSCCCSLKV